MGRIRWVTACLLLLVSGRDVIADSDLQAKVETLLGNVTRAVSGSRVDQPCIQKWVFQPALYLPAGYQHVSRIESLLMPVSDASGLAIHVVNDQIRPGITLVESGTAVSGKKYKSQCSASRSVDSLCRITDATVTLPGGLGAEQFSYCFNHELLHALGFQGHAWGMPSVMNPKSGITELGEWDQDLLKLLYSDGIQAGDTQGDLRTFLSDKRS